MKKDVSMTISNAKLIPLTRGYAAIVDPEEYDSIAGMGHWYLHSHGYACRSTNGKILFMHRIINQTPDTMHTDHRNRVRLDNRRSNLRTVTQALNNSNGPGNRTKVKYPNLPVYITWDKTRNKYFAKPPSKSAKRFKLLEEATKYVK